MEVGMKEVNKIARGERDLPIGYMNEGIEIYNSINSERKHKERIMKRAPLRIMVNVSPNVFVDIPIEELREGPFKALDSAKDRLVELLKEVKDLEIDKIELFGSLPDLSDVEFCEEDEDKAMWNKNKAVIKALQSKAGVARICVNMLNPIRYKLEYCKGKSEGVEETGSGEFVVDDNKKYCCMCNVELTHENQHSYDSYYRGNACDDCQVCSVCHKPVKPYKGINLCKEHSQG